MIESRKIARAVVGARWLAAVCYSDIKEISEATIQDWVIWYPMQKRALRPVHLLRAFLLRVLESNFPGDSL